MAFCCAECHADLSAGGHLGTCSQSVMRGGSPMPEMSRARMVVLCASCGWTDDGPDADASYRGANHLRVCPKRDDVTTVPWWTIISSRFEVGWHPIDVNAPYVVDAGSLTSRPYRVTPIHRYRFTEWADHEVIGVRQAAA